MPPADVRGNGVEDYDDGEQLQGGDGQVSHCPAQKTQGKPRDLDDGQRLDHPISLAPVFDFILGQLRDGDLARPRQVQKVLNGRTEVLAAGSRQRDGAHAQEERMGEGPGAQGRDIGKLGKRTTTLQELIESNQGDELGHDQEQDGMFDFAAGSACDGVVVRRDVHVHGCPATEVDGEAAAAD